MVTTFQQRILYYFVNNPLANWLNLSSALAIYNRTSKEEFRNQLFYDITFLMQEKYLLDYVPKNTNITTWYITDLGLQYLRENWII